MVFHNLAVPIRQAHTAGHVPLMQRAAPTVSQPIVNPAQHPSVRRMHRHAPARISPKLIRHQLGRRPRDLRSEVFSMNTITPCEPIKIALGAPVRQRKTAEPANAPRRAQPSGSSAWQ